MDKNDVRVLGMHALMVPEHEMVDSVASAILAERKRCAEVARSWEASARKLAKREKDGERALYHHLAADMARDVASNIESGQ